MNLSATLGLLGNLQWYDLKNGSQEWQLLLLSCGVVALGLMVWAAAIRKKKKRRRRHRHHHHHHDHDRDESESTAESDQPAAPEGTKISRSERRRRRRSRRDERRNPTLAETGGLPPVRWGSFNDDPDQPPPAR